MTQPALLNPPFSLPTPLPTPGASACPQSPFPLKKGRMKSEVLWACCWGKRPPNGIGVHISLWETSTSGMFSRASSSPKTDSAPASPFPRTTSSTVGLFSRLQKMASIIGQSEVVSSFWAGLRRLLCSSFWVAF